MGKYDNLLFRASSMGEIMTGVAKGWDVEKSLTCKRKLVKMDRELRWQRQSSFSNKYTEKGIQMEEDSITLYSRIKKALYVKNDERIENEFFTGEPDLYLGKDIRQSKVIVDIKSSWSWETFPSLLDVKSDYFEQIQVYLDLTGADEGIVAHCLVNTPGDIINDEKRKLAWKLQVIDNESLEYIELCQHIEKNNIVDMELFKKHYPWFEFHTEKWEYDIPMNERTHEIIIKKDPAYIEKMKDRVLECRKWMNLNL